MPWAIIFDWRLWLGGVFVALGIALVIQTSRLNGCKARLDAAQQEIAALGDRIKIQNAAVEKLKADGDARVKSAQDGLETARHATQTAKSEADRLRRAAGLKSAPGAPRPANCPPSPADRAAVTIREGL